ncbi:MAG: ribosome-associated translation inhibitor RaiA [Armatimonadetes bacterium]|nr:ribosome-associated translation inhibitor RaiA [Armatimonadota bacterium]
MPIRVQGKHIAVTDALRQYVAQKLAKLPRHFEQIQDAQVVLSTSRDSTLGRAMGVEVTVWCDGLVLRAEEFSEDMYASIDQAVQKLERQIEKYRSRMILKRRLDESRRRRRTQQSAEAALHAAEAAEGVPEMPPQVVRTKRFSMGKPMTADEAVLQMELLGHSFFVFRNAATQEVNVVYRRRDGNYGLIEPEG